jgi:hypothetical protein
MPFEFPVIVANRCAPVGGKLKPNTGSDRVSCPLVTEDGHLSNDILNHATSRQRSRAFKRAVALATLPVAFSN